ncbi:hypothetical protein C8Q77DRAFT_352302 [Trametes polyzona]|nr:hypothetical protein C8Q77DRAFT_352302 [Trametes polyzona]
MTLLHPYSMHRDSRNFLPRHDDFWPERWLIADGRVDHKPDDQAGIPPQETPHGFVHNDTAFIPLSHEPTNCVRKNLAMQEIRMVVCAILHRLEVSLCQDWDVGQYDENFKDYLITERPELPVIVRTRRPYPYASKLIARNGLMVCEPSCNLLNCFFEFV